MLDKLRGIIPALATPLNADGSVDRGGMEALVDYVIEGGVTGIFVLSSTGEGPMLTDEDRRVAVETAAEATGGRVAVLMHVPETSTARVIRWAKEAPSLGANYVVSTLPFYFRHAGKQALDFYTALADASPLPVFLYNVPYCTGVQVTAEEIQELAGHENIVGIKDSTQDWRHFQKVIRVKQEQPQFLVYNGDEEAVGSTVLMGGDGGVLGLGNVAPRLCSQLFAAADAGDLERTRRLQAQLADMQALWFMFECAHGALKMALSILGLCQPHVTSPLLPAPPELEPQVRELLARHGLV